MSTTNFQPIVNFIWSVADLLRGSYRPPQYERVVHRITVLRRFDCVLAHTKEKALASHNKLTTSGKLTNLDLTLNKIAKDCEIGWDSVATDGARQEKRFRDCFTKTGPEAEPVIAKRGSFSGTVGEGDFPGQKLVGDIETSAFDQFFGIYSETKGQKGKAVQYEGNPKLGGDENIPLKEDIVRSFLREARPDAADAWINSDAKLRDEKDSGIGKAGYEITFNREFFNYQQPHCLKGVTK